MPNHPGEFLASRRLVEELLAEGVERARSRERRTFHDLSGPSNGSLVLFGAGGLGRRCLAGLRRHGLEPLAFSDNNPRLWDTDIDGLRVLSPADAANRFGKNAVFVVTIWGARGRDRMQDRVGVLRSLGCRNVIPFGPLFWRYPDGVLPHYGVDLPHKVIEQSTAVVEALGLWADAASRREYIAQLRWRLLFDFGGMSTPVLKDIYFPPDLVRIRPGERFVDCGAFDGDTLHQFLIVSKGSFATYHAFEPDPRNFATLTDAVGELPDGVRQRIEITRAAVAAKHGRARFCDGEGPSSHIGQGSLEIETIRLDAYLGGDQATFIKMDIEGGEPDALIGASRHIRDDAPILAISCYHRQDHLWTIPIQIHSLNSQYALYLRPHDLEAWDLVCYAIPRSRLPLDPSGGTDGR